jgi:DNA invertase Pin-like site-specific DNA recombinase
MDAGASSLTLERPALQHLLADCRAGKVAKVIVQDPACLSRDAGQLFTLLQIFQDAGVRILFARASTIPLAALPFATIQKCQAKCKTKKSPRAA